MKSIISIAALFVFTIAAQAKADKNSDISTILPEGEYQIIYSPTKPDLTNRNTAPELINTKVFYKDKKPFLTYGAKEIPIFHQNTGITFTFPPSEDPHVWFVTFVFSGSPWSDTTHGIIIGRSWIIRGYPDEAQENIFKLQRIEKNTAEQDAAANP